ncbi:hypothetical protein ACRYCC_26120 [Actinomadura scrupuli]|uniref:hypothetical protein n=1 Tax=Actinomadura scrupuli TaxID=559629 RepID=UPI003D984B93
MVKRSQAPIHLAPEDARALVPLLKAGLRGLDSSRWRPGQQAEYLVVPIVLAVS